MRVTPSSTFRVELPRASAIGLFTPEGERDWVPGWDPTYPAAEPSERDGTVFVTAVGESQTIWVVIRIDRDAGTAAYARITRGRHAGTVRVSCTEAGSSATDVEISYDMTTLDASDPSALAAYETGPFAQMIDEWETLIGDYVAGRR